jgi:hypothetical protein
VHGRQKRKDEQRSSSSRLAITRPDPWECALLPFLERELEASMSTICGGRENQKIVHGIFVSITFGWLKLCRCLGQLDF